VPSLKLEEAIPIAVGSGTTRSASEMFRARKRDTVEKVELTKEEVQKAHRQKKRKIKERAKAKTNDIKQKRR